MFLSFFFLFDDFECVPSEYFEQVAYLSILGKEIRQEHVLINFARCQVIEWPFSVDFLCRLWQCSRPLKTFYNLLTLLWVIIEKRWVDVFSSGS